MTGPGESRATADREGPLGEGPLRLTLTRPVAIVMVVLAVSIFGYISLGKLPVDLMPEISYPTLTVRTEYPGSAPAEVEDRISRRIEQALAVTKGLREISSISRAGVSDVILEFDWDTEMKFAAQDVREMLDLVVLPDDAEKPILLRYDPSQDPILRVAVTGELDLVRLRKLAEDDVQRDLETVPGVAAVKVRGGLEAEIHIEVDEASMTSFSMDIGFLGGRLAQENLNLASGELVEGETEYIVRTLSEFRTLDEISDLVIEIRDGVPIRVRDVARVRRSHREREVITRIGGRECVVLDVYKEADSKIVSVADAVRERVFGTQEQQAYVASRSALAAQTEEEEEEETQDDPATVGDGDKGESGDRDGRSSDAERERRARLQRDARDRRLGDFLGNRLSAGAGLRVLSDQSRFIRAAIEEVRLAAILGGILAVAVLYLFLRNLRPTLIVATSIPISIVTTFAPMYMFDVSVNIMSLGGLALGVGMLVDNSIVVLESIARCREEGDSLTRAALRGVREVASAVTASTLTTVCVFFPIVFVEGIAGQVFRDQALTVVFALLVSLAVALFFIPMLASRNVSTAGAEAWGPGRFLRGWGSIRALRERFAPRKRRGIFLRVLRWPVLLLHIVVTFPVHLALEVVSRLLLAGLGLGLLAGILVVRGTARILRLPVRAVLAVFDLGFGGIQRAYPRVLDVALRRPVELGVLVIVPAALCFLLLPRIGSELIPEVHQGEFTARIAFPVGTPIEENARVVSALEEAARGVPGVQSVVSLIGVETDSVASSDEGEHTTRMTVTLAPTHRGAWEEEDVKARLARAFRRPEIRSVRFESPALFSFKTPIEVEILNNDLAALRRDAIAVEDHLRSLPELRDVQGSIQRGNPEIQIRFDREKLARYGMNLGKVQEILRSKVHGTVPTRYSEAEKKIDIVVKVREDLIASLQDLESLVINPGDPHPRPLRDIAAFQIREGPSEIRHIGQARGAVVTGNLRGLDLASATTRIDERLQPLRAGTDSSMIEIGGQKREMDISIRSLRNALLLAVFLVYIVMAAQFESLVQPLLILLTVPLAMVGVILALWLFEIPLSIVVFIGMIMLAGIVVNNAIVLVDSINRFRRRGMERLDAIRMGGRARLRPILMTTATTVLGLLPLTGAFGAIPPLEAWLGSLGAGEGTEIRAPMAIAVIAGLLTSTFLTLLVIPVGYSLAVRKDLPPDPAEDGGAA